MDAKTRRVLKSKQSQQGALDTSIATVANKKADENVLTPKIWTFKTKMPSTSGIVATVPGFIPLDNILTVEFVIDTGTTTAHYKSFVSYNDHLGSNFRPVIKLVDRTITTGVLGGTLIGKDVRITIFYI